MAREPRQCFGANESLAGPVRSRLAACDPFPVPVATSELGELATLHGALATGLREARRSLLAHAA